MCSVTFRLTSFFTEDSPTHSFLDVSYDLRCQSDPLRITKNNRVFGIACDPVGEMHATLVMSDSRVLMWQLKTIDYQVSSTLTSSYYYGIIVCKNGIRLNVLFLAL